MLQKIREEESVNVHSFVKELRKHRCQMVQTEVGMDVVLVNMHVERTLYVCNLDPLRDEGCSNVISKAQGYYTFSLLYLYIPTCVSIIILN